MSYFTSYRYGPHLQDLLTVCSVVRLRLDVANADRQATLGVRASAWHWQTDLLLDELIAMHSIIDKTATLLWKRWNPQCPL